MVCLNTHSLHFYADKTENDHSERLTMFQKRFRYGFQTKVSSKLDSED